MLTSYDTLTAAIQAAKKLDNPSVISQDQTTDYDSFKVFQIKDTRINDLEAECYTTSYKNKCIAIAVCSGAKRDSYLNYCDL